MIYPLESLINTILLPKDPFVFYPDSYVYAVSGSPTPSGEPYSYLTVNDAICFQLGMCSKGKLGALAAGWETMGEKVRLCQRYIECGRHALGDCFSFCVVLFSEVAPFLLLNPIQYV